MEKEKFYKIDFTKLNDVYNFKMMSKLDKQKIYSEKADLIRKAGLWQEYQKYQSAHEICVISYFCKKYKL